MRNYQNRIEKLEAKNKNETDALAIADETVGYYSFNGDEIIKKPKALVNGQEIDIREGETPKQAIYRYAEANEVKISILLNVRPVGNGTVAGMNFYRKFN